MLLQKLTPSTCKTPKKITALLSDSVGVMPKLQQEARSLEKYLHEFEQEINVQELAGAEPEDQDAVDNETLVRFCLREIESKSCINDKGCPYAPSRCVSKKCIYQSTLASTNMEKCLSFSWFLILPIRFPISDVNSNFNWARFKLFNCWNGFHSQTGLRFNANNQSECKGDNERIFNRYSYCEHQDGTLSFLRGETCSGCGGTGKYIYKWTETSQPDPESVSRGRNSSLIPAVKAATGKVKARQFINRFQRLLFTSLE